MMKKISPAILIMILFILPGWLAARALSESTAIRFGRLWDGTKMWQDAVVIVKHDRIVKVGTGKSFIPRGAAVIDLSGYTGIPGLIDVHTHMTYYWDGKPGTEPWSQLASRPSAMTLFLARENARKTLEAGVTTVKGPVCGRPPGYPDARLNQFRGHERSAHAGLRLRVVHYL
jgi:cytosine/adenosine deaminase-related metal-dependent hydrolase